MDDLNTNNTNSTSSNVMNVMNDMNDIILTRSKYDQIVKDKTDPIGR